MTPDEVFSMTNLRHPLSTFAFPLLLSLALLAGASAQQVVNLPDAPDVSSTSSLPAGVDDDAQAQGQAPSQPQTRTAPPKRLFYIIPNFRSVNTSVVLPPQTVKEKFVSASEDTFDYSSLVLALMLASYNYGLNKTPEFGTGGAAYGRYLWHSTADQSIENYMVEFIVPVITREDTRFYQMGSGGFRKRAVYSLTRVFVTRTDSGRERVNTGELLGAAGATEISSRYYPAHERTASNFLGQYATDLGIDAAAYFVREFEPEISRKIFHSRVGGPTQ
jgi:hypothetical protein